MLNFKLETDEKNSSSTTDPPTEIDPKGCSPVIRFFTRTCMHARKSVNSSKQFVFNK